MAGDQTKEQDIGCPRCGYDQRGVVEMWAEQCPLEGRCTECGLEWAWDELLGRVRNVPRWHVEYCERKRFLRAVAATFVRSLWPWGFWTRLKMSHEMRWRRMAGYAGALVLATMALVYVPVQARMALYVRSRVEQELANLSASGQMRIDTIEQQIGQMRGSNLDVASKDKWISAARTTIKQLQMTIQNDTRISHERWATTIEAIVLPLAKSSHATIGTGPTAIGYPGPIDAWLSPATTYTYLGSPIVIWTPRWHFLESLRPIRFGLCVYALMPLALLLLPITRRRARVRWSHVIRVVVYGMVIVAACCVGTLALQGVMGPQTEMEWWFSRFGPILLTLAWWWAGLRHYLRIRHARRTAVLLWIMCCLAVFATDFWRHEWFLGGYF